MKPNPTNRIPQEGITMSSQPAPQTETPENAANLSRRELLKILAAAGVGTSAALFLPGQWATPVAQVGVLPAHAQVSAPSPTPTLPVQHAFVSASAQYVFPFGSNKTPTQEDYIEASCVIAPPDANIPILIKWQNQGGSWTYDTQTVNTNASGKVTAPSTLPNTDATHPRPSCQTSPVTIHVVFAFANPTQGTGILSADALFDPPC
jgi:hypothetical protein